MRVSVGFRTYKRVVLARRRIQKLVREERVVYPREVLSQLGMTGKRRKTTRSYANFGFRQLTGYSPQDLVTVTKLRFACELLAEGWPIHYVTSRSGFYDRQQLTRRFQEWLGLTPAKYRKLAVR